jgi:hypothetical protein
MLLAVVLEVQLPWAYRVAVLEVATALFLDWLRILCSLAQCIDGKRRGLFGYFWRSCRKTPIRSTPPRAGKCEMDKRLAEFPRERFRLIEGIASQRVTLASHLRSLLKVAAAGDRSTSLLQGLVRYLNECPLPVLMVAAALVLFKPKGACGGRCAVFSGVPCEPGWGRRGGASGFELLTHGALRCP